MNLAPGLAKWHQNCVGSMELLWDLYKSAFEPDTRTARFRDIR